MTSPYVPKLSDDELADAVHFGVESWFWPVGGEHAQVMDVLRDLQQTRAEVGRLRAAERALEAIRTLEAQWVEMLRDHSEIMTTPQRNAWKNALAELRGALSAASPTTSDDKPIPMVECNFHGHAHPVGWVGCASSRRAASDEPARCPHGLTVRHYFGPDDARGYCPGPPARFRP